MYTKNTPIEERTCTKKYNDGDLGFYFKGFQILYWDTYI